MVSVLTFESIVLLVLILLVSYLPITSTIIVSHFCKGVMAKCCTKQECG